MKLSEVKLIVAYNAKVLLQETLQHYYTCSDGKYTEVPGLRSVSKGACRYLGPNGTRCAASRLATPNPDEVWVEGIGVDEPINWQNLESNVTDRILGSCREGESRAKRDWTSVLQQIVSNLQMVHDYPPEIERHISGFNSYVDVELLDLQIPQLETAQ